VDLADVSDNSVIYSGDVRVQIPPSH